MRVHLSSIELWVGGDKKIRRGEFQPQLGGGQGIARGRCAMAA
ncbi:Unknown protein sequence [Pseudomonas syringae pv. maculicola]|nr:Unknown protein sequence [Pseudomonas syringae pv. maculicola]